MVSYSSWGGLKMHAQKYLLTDVLKGELEFDGFLVTDWEAIDQIDPDFYTSVVASINAGIDMVMVPFDSYETGDYGVGKKFGWCADRYGVNWQFLLMV